MNSWKVFHLFWPSCRWFISICKTNKWSKLLNLCHVHRNWGPDNCSIYFFYSWTKNNSNDRYTSMKFELLEFAKLRFMPACVPTCQKRAKFLFLRAKVPYCVPLFYLGVPTCQMACQFFNLACQRDKSRAIFQTFLLPSANAIFQEKFLYFIIL